MARGVDAGSNSSTVWISDKTRLEPMELVTGKASVQYDPTLTTSLSYSPAGLRRKSPKHMQSVRASAHSAYLRSSEWTFRTVASVTNAKEHFLHAQRHPGSQQHCQRRYHLTMFDP